MYTYSLYLNHLYENKKLSPSGQNRQKSSLTIWHGILSAELTKTHPFRLLFGDFAHWSRCNRYKKESFLVSLVKLDNLKNTHYI